MDQQKNEAFSIILYSFTVLFVIAGIYVAWQYISNGDSFGFEIEWRFWKSPILFPALSFIGFFLQFIDWQHTSFREGWVVKDSWGNEKFVENNDIMSVLFGSCIVPLLMHFIFIPCMYGALLYYVIIIPLALLNALIPYLAAAAAIGVAALYYFMSRNMDEGSHPLLKLLGATILSAGLLVLIYLPTTGIISKSTPVVEEVQPAGPVAIGTAEVTAKVANLRIGPGTNYDYYTSSDGTKVQVTCGNQVEVVEDQGEWFKILVDGTNTAYIKKTLCKEFVPYSVQMDDEIVEEPVVTEVTEGPEVVEPIDEVMDELVANEVEEKSETEKSEQATTVDETPAPVASSEEGRIYDIVEENASFPGGDEYCYKWLAEHIQYPAIAAEQGIQGRVFVQFVVNTDGSIVDVKVVRSPDPSLSKEAIRVVQSMPKWKPARKDNQPVRSRFSLPIMFRFNN